MVLCGCGSLLSLIIGDSILFADEDEDGDRDEAQEPILTGMVMGTTTAMRSATTTASRGGATTWTTMGTVMGTTTAMRSAKATRSATATKFLRPKL